MTTCIFCGLNLEDGTLICEVCGSSQPEQPAAPAAYVPRLTPTPRAPPQPGPPSPAPVASLTGPRLVLYGADKQPKQVFSLTKDATLIGRLDAVEGNFPDIDVKEWLDEAGARRVSRKHALIVRQRASNSYLLRPLPGNSGTQIEADMVSPGEDYPLAPGARFVLGASARFKFEA